MAALILVSPVEHATSQLDKVERPERFVSGAKIVEMPPPHIVDV
jgi:hypothetical protein